ncbi:MAG: hypothetical protein AAGD14_05295 [Planctomycetota bacterium]
MHDEYDGYPESWVTRNRKTILFCLILLFVVPWLYIAAGTFWMLIVTYPVAIGVVVLAVVWVVLRVRRNRGGPGGAGRG